MSKALEGGEGRREKRKLIDSRVRAYWKKAKRKKREEKWRAKGDLIRWALLQKESSTPPKSAIRNGENLGGRIREVERKGRWRSKVFFRFRMR